MERNLKFSCGINENGILYVPYREVIEQIEKSCGDGFNDGMAKGSIGNDEESIRVDERAKVLAKVTNLKNEYTDACNMCTKTDCDVCVINNFIEQLENIISNK